jgi:DNA (cytosine-5)-methyltransferase 1
MIPEPGKPRLLDLFCGAGGCTRGYQEAGFYVVGVDINPQPSYCGDEFVQGDALSYLGGVLTVASNFGRSGWDAFHASPPCQAYTKASGLWDNDHPELVGPVRSALLATGLPYVIENVKGAPLHDPQVLEGQMFGLNTHRPRLFETNWSFEAPVLRPSPPPQAKMGRPPRPGEAIQVVGHFSDLAAGRRALGIDWMNRDELSQAIPPAYTRHIGEHLLSHIDAQTKAAA